MSEPPAPGSTDRTLDREIGAAYRTMLVFLGASLAVALAAGAYVLLVSQPQVIRLTDTARAVRQAHNAMLDQQTGLRGYLSTGQDRFLVPYHNGRRHLASADDDLVRSLTADPAVAELTIEQRLQQQAWMTFAEQARADGPVAGDPQGAAAVFDQDKALFDPYRATQVTLAAHVVGRRDEAIDQQHQLMFVVLLVQVASIIGTLVVFQRRMQRLSRLVGEPVKQVRAAMKSLQEGAWDARVTPAGVRDMQEVGEGFNEMAAAIDEQTQLAGARERDLVQHTGSLTQILKLSREIAGNLNIRYVQEAVASACLSVSGSDAVIIYLTDEDRASLVPSHDSRGPGARAQEAPIAIGEGIAGEAAAVGRRVTSSDGRVVGLPMVVGARVIGVLSLTSKEPVDLSSRALEVLETLATHSATAIEAARLHETTKELSTVDALTTLPNRRRFDDELALEVERSVRYERPLGLIMLDIDHFKSLNDTYGHQTGDEALQAVAQAISTTLRGSDTAYRYGGEEFAVILRETSIPDALLVAERIRDHIERRFASWRKGRSITVSLGVADTGQAGEPKLLVAAADAALYRAKAQGRNRVVTDADAPDAGKSVHSHVRPVD